MKKFITLIIALILTANCFSQNVYTEKDKQGMGTGIFLGGLAFTGAAIFTDGNKYGTYVNANIPGNPYAKTYVIPPVWKQTPRNIMFVVGVSFSIVGLISMFNHR